MLLLKSIWNSFIWQTFLDLYNWNNGEVAESHVVPVAVCPYRLLALAGCPKRPAPLISDVKPLQWDREVTCCPDDLPASCVLWLLYFCWAVWGVWRHTRKPARSCQLLDFVLSLVVSCWCCCCVCNPDQKSLREWWNGWVVQVQFVTSASLLIMLALSFQ